MTLARWKFLNPSIGRIRRLIARWSCSRGYRRTERATFTALRSRTALSVVLTPALPTTKTFAVHLSIDPQMNVHQIAITEDNVSDEAGLNAVLAVEANVDGVIADGAYYSIAQTEAWSACGVLPVIPPPANAVVHNRPATRWHDHLVRYIKDKGIHAFRSKYGYGQRALVEAQISRIKRCIGARLLTRNIESQQREGVIIANLVNLWNSFGKAICVKKV
ncbi:transposase [Paraburkholderia azotifigens]|uniref:transposase n=1 Tax=Paraburkholderia azotifigens TaxID=2057004 RepID=UPI00316B56C1